jgi:hypothetical protein
MVSLFQDCDQALERLQTYSRRLEYALNRSLNQLRKLREHWGAEEETSDLVQELCDEESDDQAPQDDSAEQVCKTKPPRAEDESGPEDAQSAACPIQQPVARGRPFFRRTSLAPRNGHALPQQVIPSVFEPKSTPTIMPPAGVDAAAEHELCGDGLAHMSKQGKREARNGG